MNSFFYFTLAFLFLTMQLQAQSISSRYATKAASTTLSWTGSAPVSAVNSQCGLQYIPQDQQINLVIYPSLLTWPRPEEAQAFMREYVDEAQFRSAHFDGTLTLPGNPNLQQPGTYIATASGLWTWKGQTAQGTLTGTLEVLSQNGILKCNLNGNFQLNDFNIQPNQRDILDLPNLTQVHIVADLMP
jgi:hypothetical protein